MERITRRSFIKTGAAAVGTTLAAAACTRPWLDAESTQNGGATTTTGAPGLEETWVKTTCALCSSGCGLMVRVAGGRAVKVEGNPLHPLNQGVCCLKGQASLEMLYSPERIHRPLRRLGGPGSGKWQELEWDDALAQVATRMSALRETGEAHTAAFLHGETRGQMRALIHRFMTAYGSPNVISRSGRDEEAARRAMFLTQGIDGIPVYDLSETRFVITFGGNLLEASRHLIGHIGELGFLRRGRPDRGRLVSVHPRLSLTGIKADEWVPIRPDTYGALALGMANVIIRSNLYDQDFIRDFTFGFEDFEDETGNRHVGFKRWVLERYPLDHVATLTGIAASDIARLAGEFAMTRPAIAVLPTEPGGSSCDRDVYTAMAIHALNAMVGSIDVRGGVLTQRFPRLADWPELPVDTKARSSLEQARLDSCDTEKPFLNGSSCQTLVSHALAGEPYPLNLLFLYNVNPVFESPDGQRFAEALDKIPLVVSFASTLDESAAHADLVLPASTFLEEWGDDFVEGTGYAGISLRRPVVAPVHDTRNPGDVLLDLAHRVGGPLAAALPWDSYQALVDHRLSGLEVDRARLEENGVWSEMVYFHATPGSRAWAEVVGRDRLNAPKDGRFDFFSRELFAALNAPDDSDCLPRFDLPVPLALETLEAATYPFLLLTQTLITQPGAGTGIIPALQECYGLQADARWSSWVEINPRAARALQVKTGDLVWIESAEGRVQVPVRLYEGIWPNAVFMPAGQGHRTLVQWGRGSRADTDIGVNPMVLAGGAARGTTARGEDRGVTTVQMQPGATVQWRPEATVHMQPGTSIRVRIYRA